MVWLRMLWPEIAPFFKGVFGGLASFLVAWIAILVVVGWQWHAARVAQGVSNRLGATAGGLTLLMHTPWVL